MPKELDDAQNEILKGVTEHEEAPLGGENDDDNDVGGANDDDADDQDYNNDLSDENDDDDDGKDGVDEDEDEPRGKKKGPDDDEDEPRRKPSTEPVDDEEETLFKYEADRKGNLLDTDGKILFPVGRSRNTFLKLKKAWAQGRDRNAAVVAHAQKLATAGQQLLKQYQDLKATANPGATKGLTASENDEAVTMMAMMKIDPKAAIRAILTKVHMAGTDLKDLGITGPVDAKEVARHQHEMAEAARTKRIEERRTSLRNSAKEEATSFLIANPEAGRYLGMITKAKYDHPHMTLDQIWTQLRRAAQKAADDQKNKGRNRERPNGGNRQMREPPARNGSRNRPTGQKLSNKAVDPSMSFKQIGQGLLADIKRMEQE